MPTLCSTEILLHTQCLISIFNILSKTRRTKKKHMISFLPSYLQEEIFKEFRKQKKQNVSQKRSSSKTNCMMMGLIKCPHWNNNPGLQFFGITLGSLCVDYTSNCVWVTKPHHIPLNHESALQNSFRNTAKLIA